MTPRELAHTLQGEMLDHFKLQQFVGGGGMGVVFKGLDLANHDQVVTCIDLFEHRTVKPRRDTLEHRRAMWACLPIHGSEPVVYRAGKGV